MRHPSLTTAVTLGLAVTALSGLTLIPALAQDAASPGPATAPPPPGTTTPSPEQPAAAPTPPNYKIQYNGLIDGYLQYSLQNPHGTQLGNGGPSGIYNARVKTPTLQLAEVNVFNMPKPGGVAFKATLIAGDTADQNHLNYSYTTGATNGSGGEAEFKNVQQLYGTYAFAGAGGGIDVGKFYTPFGYEVTEASGDYNYTRSLAYNILPFYHAGIRIYSPSYKGLVVTVWVTNDLYNTTTEGVHHQGDYAYMGQLNYTDPQGKFTAISTLGFGNDMSDGILFAAAGVKTRDMVNDNDFTYNINANQLIGLNYDYAHFKPSDGTPDTTAYGYAAYYRQALTPKNAFALRYSGNSVKTNGSPSIMPKEATATYEYKAAANFTTRLEYRHDFSNQTVFLGKNDTARGGGSKKSEDLVVLAGLFSF